MKKSVFKRGLAFFLACLMVGSFGSVYAFAADDDLTQSSSGSKRTLAEINEILNTISYAEYRERHADEPQATGTLQIEAADYYADGTDAYVETVDNYRGMNGKSLVIGSSGTTSWKVNVPKSGMYAISLEYFPIDKFVVGKDDETKEGEGEKNDLIGKSASVERLLLINGKVPFSEARYLSMSKVWNNIYETDENGERAFKSDLNGNNVRPEAEQAPEWRTYELSDSTGYYVGALEFYLEAGENTIALEAVREPVAIRSFTLYPKVGGATYADVTAEYAKKGYTAAATTDTVYINAEMPDAISDESIYPYTDRTSAKTEPQSAKAQVLNTIGGSENYKTAGQWIRYDFEVPVSGLYNVLARYKQSELSGMFTTRIVKINGEILFDEANYTRFDYSKEWQLEPLGDGEQDFEFYFEAGKKYTIELEVGLGKISDTIRRVEESLTNINSAYLEIMKLTGSSPDKYRDYGFYRLMPQTISVLVKEYYNLTAVSDELTALAGTKGSHVATLDKVSNLLQRMGSAEDQIAKNLENLKSYIGTLGTWLNSTRNQPLQLDYLMIVPSGTKAPSANTGFFGAMWFEIQLFVNSFIVDYSSMGKMDTGVVTDLEPIEAWISEGRDQAIIIRNMIGSSFTPQTGIPVNLKLVAAGTLLPSVLSGQGPDVFLGIGAADVINYAIRSAVLPLNDYEGFDEIFAEFTDAATIPVTLEGVTYGLPEKMNFSMMFYRKDILANLGIDIPQTWDDVLAALPVLQANNMQIGLVRDCDIFLYQMGGDRYADNGMRTGIDSDIGLESFEYYVSFYTMYSFPVTYEAANRFRTGEMPIIIADYTSIYNQLTVFATEIRGLWEFVPLPGVKRVAEDGTVTVNNDTVAAITSLVMLNGVQNTEADPTKEERTWSFMKWFCGADAQSAYSNGLITTIGPAAKYPTANKNALADMPWTTDEYNNLMEQFDHVAAIANYPGGYIMARYLNFAFLAAVNDDADPVEELRKWITSINKEITRKRQEFGMDTLELGETLESRAKAQAESGTTD